MHVYHYHATTQRIPGQIEHFDGIVTSGAKVLEYQGLQGVRKDIAEAWNPKVEDYKKVTIESLTYLGEVI